jgi:hypothetical protein
MKKLLALALKATALSLEARCNGDMPIRSRIRMPPWMRRRMRASFQPELHGLRLICADTHLTLYFKEDLIKTHLLISEKVHKQELISIKFS